VSAYGALGGVHRGPVEIDLDVEARLQRFVLAAHSAGAVRAAHDRAEGGLAVALAEIAIRDGIGMRVSLPLVPGSHTRETLFGEGPSAILLVIDPGRAEDVVALAREDGVALWTLGSVGGDLLEIAPVIGMPVGSPDGPRRPGVQRAGSRCPRWPRHGRPYPLLDDRQLAHRERAAAGGRGRPARRARDRAQRQLHQRARPPRSALERGRAVRDL